MQAASESRKAAPILESGGGADPRSARNALVPPPRIPGHATRRLGSPQSGSYSRSNPTHFPIGSVSQNAPHRASHSPKNTQTNPPSLPIGSVSQNRARPLRTLHKRPACTPQTAQTNPTHFPIGSVSQNAPRRAGHSPKNTQTNPPPSRLGSVSQKPAGPKTHQCHNDPR